MQDEQQPELGNIHAFGCDAPEGYTNEVAGDAEKGLDFGGGGMGAGLVHDAIIA